MLIYYQLICLLYLLYPNKASWIAEICYNFKITEYKDDFNDQLNLKWEIVANRYTNYLRTQGFPAFEMTSTKGICIYLSLEYLNEKAYILPGLGDAGDRLNGVDGENPRNMIQLIGDYGSGILNLYRDQVREIEETVLG